MNNLIKFKTKMTIWGSITIGILIQHYGSKIWSYKESKDQIIESINNKLTKITELLNKQETIIIKAKDRFIEGFTKLAEASQNLNDLFNNGKDKLFSSLSPIYDYLDSLTLLEESALFHIVVLLVILSIAFNIYSVLFGNEVIKYFKLEEKYPRLHIFFKLRLQFQRYYLILNLILLIIICTVAISLNILVLA